MTCVYQVTLHADADDAHIGHRLETWLEVDPRIKEGVTLTLKEFPGITWEVIEFFGHTVLDSKSLYKPWRVGGLE